MSPLHAEVLALARSYLGTREIGTNSGPEIDRMLAYSKCRPGDAWCAAYVTWCIQKAAVTVPPVFHGSAGALRMVFRNPDLEVTAEIARELLYAGELLVGVIRHPGGKGHVLFAHGLTKSERIISIEGNTGPGPNVPAKDRDGDGIYARRDRPFASIDFWLRVA